LIARQLHASLCFFNMFWVIVQLEYGHLFCHSLSLTSRSRFPSSGSLYCFQYHCPVQILNHYKYSLLTPYVVFYITILFKYSFITNIHCNSVCCICDILLFCSILSVHCSHCYLACFMHFVGIARTSQDTFECSALRTSSCGQQCWLHWVIVASRRSTWYYR